MAKTGLLLRLYLLASRAIPLVTPSLLKRRLKRGKEDPTRWREKLGQYTVSRPDSPLIWLHAVGLGEVMSLRGLIAILASKHPQAHFLVTSTTAKGAEVFTNNLPSRTLHQFLPLDAPRYRRAFLDHFQPDLAVWVEQDLWPGLVVDAHISDIPQAIIAARMDARAYASHSRARTLYSNLYRRMALITAQEAATAGHLTQLGATDVQITGSLKPIAPPLACDESRLQQLRTLTKGRFIWCVASAHPADIAVARNAHRQLLRHDPTALLIIAPRFPDLDITADDGTAVLSLGQDPELRDHTWIYDALGDMGLLYRLVDAALIGGTFSNIEGHNPWEAVTLGTPVLHGPHTANFATDYQALDHGGGAHPVKDATDVVSVLQTDLAGMAAKATALRDTYESAVGDLADKLLSLIANTDAQ